MIYVQNSGINQSKNDGKQSNSNKNVKQRIHISDDLLPIFFQVSNNGYTLTKILEEIESDIKKSDQFIHSAADYNILVTEMIAKYHSFLASLSEMNQSCIDITALLKNKSEDSPFYEYYDEASKHCNKTLNELKDEARRYAVETDRMIALAKQANEAAQHALKQRNDKIKEEKAIKLYMALYPLLKQFSQRSSELELLANTLKNKNKT